MEDTPQLGLTLTGRAWPAHSRFPHNHERPSVGERLLEDLEPSREPLVVTGYGGLEQLLDLLSRWEERRRTGGAPSRIRLLVGAEPAGGGAFPTARLQRLRDEVRDHWLEQGLSLLQAGELLAAIDLAESGLLSVRTSGGSRVHAKIYVGDDAVTLGSSNYTRPGLTTNVEANARFARADEPERFDEAVDLAEHIWDQGREFTTEFRELLERLIKMVSWVEALARAVAEILDREEPQRTRRADVPLWPSQDQGINEALWVLENSGAVLIADATGSGKTRTGAHLVSALNSHLWRHGRARARQPVLICPPAVAQAWQNELARAEESVTVFSHGVLQSEASVRRDELHAALRGADVLVIDEAHNFLNFTTNRTRALLGNTATHVVLLTATPINRGASDLAGIVDLLGADNFEDETLDRVKSLSRAGGASRSQPTAGSSEEVRDVLQRFVVRRTKSDFNRLVDREPDRYHNAAGDPCRFPNHVPIVFDRLVTPDDEAAARAIQAASERLKGLINLRKTLRMPRWYTSRGFSEEQFARMRLRGAAALAAYHVRSRLRSSRAALVEHLVGTKAALAQYEIVAPKASHSGDVLTTLKKIAGRPPAVELDCDEVPEWLLDPDAHRAAVEAEIEAYGDILRNAKSLGDGREDANADYLVSLAERHGLVLAFDSHPISLMDLRERLRTRGIDPLMATGEHSISRRLRFSARFGLHSKHSGIGLCSDALAEGLNLQGASAVMHLDMPTVVRVLEQRIGRVDRMDSPHAEIEVHWPREPEPFQMRSDERIFLRLRDVEELIGSNVPIPAEFDAPPARVSDPLTVEDVIEAVERASDGARVSLSDAFDQVRALLEDEPPLIPSEVYQSVRSTGARVLSSVSVVRADTPWVFVALGASDRSVPRWVLCEGEPGPHAHLVDTLDGVAERLQELLQTGSSDLPFDAAAASLLEGTIELLEKRHHELLPTRKRNALAELRHVVSKYKKAASKDGDAARTSICRQILGLLDESSSTVDRVAIADWWIRLIRPEWHDLLSGGLVRRPVRLRKLRPQLARHPVSTERLETILEVDLEVPPLDRRIVAAIVGVPTGSSASSLHPQSSSRSKSSRLSPA